MKILIADSFQKIVRKIKLMLIRLIKLICDLIFKIIPNLLLIKFLNQ